MKTKIAQDLHDSGLLAVNKRNELKTAIEEVRG
jgi:hypothetical protein